MTRILAILLLLLPALASAWGGASAASQGTTIGRSVNLPTPSSTIVGSAPSFVWYGLTQCTDSSGITAFVADINLSGVELQCSSVSQTETAYHTWNWTTMNAALSSIHSASSNPITGYSYHATTLAEGGASNVDPTWWGTTSELGGPVSTIGGTSIGKNNYQPTASAYTALGQDWAGASGGFAATLQTYIDNGTVLRVAMGLMGETDVLGCLSNAFAGSSYTLTAASYGSAIQSDYSAFLNDFGGGSHTSVKILAEPPENNTYCPGETAPSWFNTYVTSTTLANGNTLTWWGADGCDPKHSCTSYRVSAQVTAGYGTCGQTVECGAQPDGAFSCSTGQAGGNPKMWGRNAILAGFTYSSFYKCDWTAAYAGILPDGLYALRMQNNRSLVDF